MSGPDAATTATRGGRGVRERVRAPAAGAFSAGSRAVERSGQTADDGRLDENEIGELLYAWGGFDAGGSFRSAQGMIEDRLLRAPPSDLGGVQRAIRDVLRDRGRQGVDREKLCAIVCAEEGATRYEALTALHGLRRRGDVEYFVGERERAKDVAYLRHPGEMLTGPERRDVGGDAEAKEVVQVEMARLSDAIRLSLAGEQPHGPGGWRERRWRAADDALKRSWRIIECGESSRGGQSPTPVVGKLSKADALIGALRRLPAPSRRALERAYGAARHVHPLLEPWAILGQDVARLVPETKAVERARCALVVEKSTPKTRATVDRATYGADALRAVLDDAPEGEPARERWREARALFVDKAGAEAKKMLAEAVRAWRVMRALV